MRFVYEEKTLPIKILIAFFLQGINGKITDTECVDDITCGVCKAKCKDYKDDCPLENEQCDYDETFQTECPKTCATCDVCEDLIDPLICNEEKHVCIAWIHVMTLELFCLSLSKRYTVWIHVMTLDFCNVQKLSGSCENNEVVKKMCKKTCHLCDTEQC
ncbi:unnamed protein product [Lepeophtheirus salmonis]|uniref:(salmon louse) hypothetical protein n=1 Tax=Lepeophtheirus salmonis TaxID=72036 RepID=A0A7R8D8R8_LEPSM|nr:unnamed protein product [Lepeophtheirus salmonis]CAF3037317.1 unnamed protein product [Lepeophtheirus salmonis]